MPWTINFQIVDAKNAQSSTQVNLPISRTFEEVEAFAAAMAPLLNALTTGAITRISITRSVALPGGLRATPDANSDVEEGARFQFRTANGFQTALRIPTFAESKIPSTSKDVNLADTDVAAFVTAMTTGIDLPGALPVVQPSDARGEDITSLTFAREQFVSSR